MIKFILFCLVANVASAMDFDKAQLSSNDVSEISAAIFKIEGGAKTAYPFGIRSINTHGDTARAKQICENTIRHNFKRWNSTNKTNDFLTFLANRYCPANADKQGNLNWIKNIYKLVK